MPDETRFATLADAVLMRLFETIDGVAGDRLDVDLGEGVLTIETEDGGQYVVNKHAPSRQIWMSSPVSGARHFAYDEPAASWVDTRAASGGEAVVLEVILGRELGAALGRELDLAAPEPRMGAA